MRCKKLPVALRLTLVKGCSFRQTGESFSIKSLKKKALFEPKAPSLQAQSFSNQDHEGQDDIVQGGGPEKRDRLENIII